MPPDIKSLKALRKFSEGWRGIIYVGYLRGQKVALKVAKDRNRVRAINREAQILERLKGLDMFPQLLFKGEGYFCYSFIEAKPFRRVFPELDREKRGKVLLDILYATYLLDRLGIRRNEFSRVDKNILIDDSLRVYILDFDRGSFTERASNLPQFLQFLVREGILELRRAVELWKRYSEDREGVYERVADSIRGYKRFQEGSL
jgi:putative serine/threonine protein kinase